MAIRQVWSIEELVNILRAVAMQGGDRRTIAAIAVALGIKDVVTDAPDSYVFEIPGGRIDITRNRFSAAPDCYGGVRYRLGEMVETINGEAQRVIVEAVAGGQTVEEVKDKLMEAK